MKKIALYFGSFNPIHKGHETIARYFAQIESVHELWMIVSPHNPLKLASDLAPDLDRLEMARIATRDIPKVKVSNVEFGLPKPSYTIDTMRFLQSEFPDCEWSIILGEDSLASFPRWKNYEELLREFEIMVFPREGVQANFSLLADQKSVKLYPTPLINISSTEVRRKCMQGESLSELISTPVEDYIRLKGLYS